MSSCHRNFFFGNAFRERQIYRKKFGPKAISIKEPDENRLRIKWLCHNSTIDDRSQLAAYNDRWSINIHYVQELPDNYCVLN